MRVALRQLLSVVVGADFHLLETVAAAECGTRGRKIHTSPASEIIAGHAVDEVDLEDHSCHPQ